MPGYWEWLPRMIRKSMAGSVSVQVTSWSPEAAKVAPGSRLAARSLTVSQRVHRGHDVLGAKLLAVVEGDTLAQLDGVGQAVIGDLIALGQHGLGLVVAIEAKERLDDVADDVHGHKRRRGVRIETVRARR